MWFWTLLDMSVTAADNGDDLSLAFILALQLQAQHLDRQQRKQQQSAKHDHIIIGFLLH